MRRQRSEQYFCGVEGGVWELDLRGAGSGVELDFGFLLKEREQWGDAFVLVLVNRSYNERK